MLCMHTQVTASCFPRVREQREALIERGPFPAKKKTPAGCDLRRDSLVHRASFDWTPNRVLLQLDPPAAHRRRSALIYLLFCH